MHIHILLPFSTFPLSEISVKVLCISAYIILSHSFVHIKFVLYFILHVITLKESFSKCILLFSDLSKSFRRLYVFLSALRKTLLLYRLLVCENVFADQNILILCLQNDKDKLVLSYKKYIMFLKKTCVRALPRMTCMYFFFHIQCSIYVTVCKCWVLTSNAGLELAYNLLCSILLWKCKTHLLKQRHFLIPFLQ